MNELNLIAYGFISLLALVIFIGLFVRIWKMTNDIKDIKSLLIDLIEMIENDKNK